MAYLMIANIASVSLWVSIKLPETWLKNVYSAILSRSTTDCFDIAR